MYMENAKEVAKKNCKGGKRREEGVENIIFTSQYFIQGGGGGLAGRHTFNISTPTPPSEIKQKRKYLSNFFREQLLTN